VLLKEPWGLGLGLLVTGTVLWVSERLATGERPLDSLGAGDAFWIGVAQAVALAPGVSRSGMTVGAGLASGLERGAAVVFGFLLGAVAIAGATVLKLKEIVAVPKGELVPMALGFAASLVVSMAALWLVTLVVRRKRLFCFTIYCYAVGSAVLLAKLAGVW
jgi:undecaprenyl-diphosphatase